MRPLVALAFLLIAQAQSPVRRVKTFSRVTQNGSLLSASRPMLNLSGPLICSDNSISQSIDCYCPNRGIGASASVQALVTAGGQTDIAAPWVTANTFIACTAIAPVPVAVSVVPDSLQPGVGFSVVTASSAFMVSINIACIGAVLQ